MHLIGNTAACTLAVLFALQMRYVSYLEGVAGSRNVWRWRCAACGRKIRGNNHSIVARQVGPALMSQIFHSKPSCQALAKAYGQEPRTKTLHIDGQLVDFSRPFLGEDGKPVCTCTHGAQCVTCYEESL